MICIDPGPNLYSICTQNYCYNHFSPCCNSTCSNYRDNNFFFYCGYQNKTCRFFSSFMTSCFKTLRNKFITAAPAFCANLLLKPCITFISTAFSLEVNVFGFPALGNTKGTL